MKQLFRRIVPVMLVWLVLGGSAWAQSRIATVDLDKLLANYWKAKQARAALDERKGDLDKEDAELRDNWKKANEEYQKLLTTANDPAISDEERDKRKKAAEAKLKDIKDVEDTIVRFERSAQTTLVELSGRLRDNLLNDIRTTVNAKAKSGGYAMVLNTAAESVSTSSGVLNLHSPVIYSNSENDLTDTVLSQLNAAAPIETPKLPEKQEDKTDANKQDQKK